MQIIRNNLLKKSFSLLLSFILAFNLMPPADIAEANDSLIFEDVTDTINSEYEEIYIDEDWDLLNEYHPTINTQELNITDETWWMVGEDASNDIVARSARLTISMNTWSPGPMVSSIRVNVTSNTRWNISGNVNWLSVSGITPNSLIGNGGFSIHALSNNTTNSRTGQIRVIGGGIARIINVTQARSNTLTLSRSTWSTTALASNATVNVTSNTTWNVSSNVNWLSISNISPTNRTRNGSFRINATRNTATSQRTGTITVTGAGTPTRTINVTQARGTLTLSRTADWTPSALANNLTVNVTSNTTWNVSSNVSWMTISNINPANRTGNGSFRINTTRNTTAGTRTGTITVTAPGATNRTIRVTQARATLTLSASTWSPGSLAVAGVVNVTSNATWNVSSNVSWMTISNITPANRTGNGSFRINVATNTNTSQRTGTITVSGGGAPARTIPVTQARANTLSLSRSNWNPNSPASNTIVSVASNATWTVRSSVNWLSISTITPSNRTGNGSFRINATTNTTTGSRTGIITVTAPGAPTRTISVTQARATLTLSRTTAWTPTSPASNTTVNVTSTAQWNVSSNVNWLTISNIAPTNRNGNGSFRINATTNTTTGSRTGTITVTAPGTPTRTISVTQARATLTLSRTTAWTPTSPASNTTVDVASTAQWNVSSNVNWLTISNIAPTNRNGNGSFRINAATNTTTSNRTGTITVTAPGAPTRTISVTQARATLTLSRSTWSPQAVVGSNVTVNVTVNVTANAIWNVSSNVNWLTISNIAPTNRNGNGSFRINVTHNPNSAQRTGTITVTALGAPTRTIAVSQLGTIWHSVGAGDQIDWVGFWPGAINVQTQTVGVVSNGFQFNTRVNEARGMWSDALGININSTTNATTAQIRAFGGSRERIEEFRGDRLGTTAWGGLAESPTRTREGSVTSGNITRNVYRFSGQTRMFVIERIVANNWSQDNINRTRKTTNHELGHVLGYWGHSPKIATNEQDVMWYRNSPYFQLSQNESRHLRQIYQSFR